MTARDGLEAAQTTGKTMVLGFGVPKAGTTWLYGYLGTLPNYAMGFAKEYHVWDAIKTPGCQHFVVPDGQPILNMALLFRREMQRYPSCYFDYFQQLLEAPDKTLTADLTPSHCGLPSATMRALYDGFAERGLKVRIVVLLRDPVERCWSMLRMIRANPKGFEPIGVDWSKSDDDLLRDYAHSENARIRTQYDQILHRLGSSGIPMRHVYLGLYETMFRPGPLKALSQFLGVPYRPELIETRINVSPKTQSISPETAAYVARLYAPAYAAAARILPAAKQVWPGFSHLTAASSAAV